LVHENFKLYTTTIGPQPLKQNEANVINIVTGNLWRLYGCVFIDDEKDVVRVCAIDYWSDEYWHDSDKGRESSHSFYLRPFFGSFSSSLSSIFDNTKVSVNSTLQNDELDTIHCLPSCRRRGLDNVMSGGDWRTTVYATQSDSNVNPDSTGSLNSSRRR
jgi:hypothetical protein